MDEAVKELGPEDKLAKLMALFKGLPVEFLEIPRVRKIKVVPQKGRPIYLELEKESMESLAAKTASALFESIYEKLKRRVEDKRGFANDAYYHIVGYLGNNIASSMKGPYMFGWEETKKVPRWLKKARQLGEYGPCGWAYGFSVDHPFYAPGDKYVSEPYSMSMRDFEGLIAFCKSNGLTFTVFGHSRWFPGHTFRVIIEPEKRQEEQALKGA
jgi:hypothetical protein